MSQDRIEGRLPHYDRGKPNIRALLEPAALEVAELEGVAEAIRQSLYLSSATGAALGAFASRWGLARNPGEGDGQLRGRIRDEIMLCLSSGTTEDLKAGLQAILGWTGTAVKVSSNWSPTLLEEFPAFFEVRVPLSWLKAEPQKYFRFSDEEESTWQSEYGFNRGLWRWPIASNWLDYPWTADTLLDRLAAVGIRFLVGVYGGFRFSMDPEVSTFESDRGFDAGGLVGIVGR